MRMTSRYASSSLLRTLTSIVKPMSALSSDWMMVVLAVFFLGVDSLFGWIVRQLLSLAA